MEPWVQWVTVAATAFGVPWAILTFRQTNRVKAAEIVLGLEQGYTPHIKTLLRLEYRPDYVLRYREALRKAMDPAREPMTEEESEALDEVDAALRHFFLCANVRRLSVDAGAVERLCAYYLQVLVNPERPELLRYVRQYWPPVFYWAQTAGRPWPLKAWIAMGQLPARFRDWRQETARARWPDPAHSAARAASEGRMEPAP